MLKFTHLAHTLQFTTAPQRRGEFNDALFKPCGFITALVFWQQDGAIVSEAKNLTRQRLVPGSASHASCHHGIEQMTACGRKQDASQQPVSRCELTAKHRLRLRHVLPFIAKALRAKIVGHAFLCDGLPALRCKCRIEIRFAQPDGEAIAAMNATPQLARVAGDAQHAQPLRFQHRSFRRCLPRHVQAKPLARDRMSVLQPAMADQPPPNAHCICQSRSSRVAIQISLFRPHKTVLSLTRRLKTEHLLHHKVFRLNLETCTT